MDAIDARNMQSNLAVNKYLHTVTSRQISSTCNYDTRNHEYKKKSHGISIFFNVYFFFCWNLDAPYRTVPKGTVFMYRCRDRCRCLSLVTTITKGSQSMMPIELVTTDDSAREAKKYTRQISTYKNCVSFKNLINMKILDKTVHWTASHFVFLVTRRKLLHSKLLD